MAKAVAVKMVAPSATQPAPRVVKAVAIVPKKHRSPLQRVALARPQDEEPFLPAPYVVFTAWQQQVEMAHLTLAVAQYTTDSQPHFAAVAVRGGWILIQL